MSDNAEELTLTPLAAETADAGNEAAVGEPAEAPARLERLSFAFARRHGVMLGDWDEEGGGKFRPFAHDRFCFGPINNGGINAPTAIPDGDGGGYLMHMLNHGLVTGDWNGIMSLPCRLRLGPGDTVFNEPVAALEALNDQLYRSCVQCHRNFRTGYGRRR